MYKYRAPLLRGNENQKKLNYQVFLLTNFGYFQIIGTFLPPNDVTHGLTLKN